MFKIASVPSPSSGAFETGRISTPQSSALRHSEGPGVYLENKCSSLITCGYGLGQRYRDELAKCSLPSMLMRVQGVEW